MDSLRAARYPFLSEASEFAEANSEGIEKLLSSETYADARERGLARVLGALDNHTIPENSLSGEYNRLMEVLSYPYARILVSCVGDRLLLKRYALAEAEHMNHILTKD
ncbi:MAG: DNA primase, partial [Candidatus Methanomethylophilus sp.]|nr:DNA primase [Methanomethylophilus sp.]